MITRPCPVCGSTDYSRVFAEANYDFGKLDAFAFASRKTPEYMHFRLISCPVCDLLYSNPIPEAAGLGKAYEEASYDSAEEAQYASRTYAAFLGRIKKRLPDLDGAIDIGAGDGAFLERLLESGFTRVSGIEPSRAPIAAARQSVRPLIRQGLFDPADFKDESASLITCFQTLEHLNDPAAMCRAAHRILKKGGAVFFICHNRSSVSARLLGMKSPIFDIEHLQLFSKKSIEYLLRECGFSEVETRPVYNSYPLYYWIKLLPLPAAIKRRSTFFFKKTLGDFTLMLPAGNMAAIGYKK